MSGTALVVDLDRIAANLTVLRAHVAPAHVLFVVKDDAYGHGVDAVARTAASVGVDWFGSFDVPTGLRVRAAAPDARVFAWATSERADIAAAASAGIELGVGDAGYLEDVASAAGGRGIRVHLKIDTGLHRNGVRPEAWPAFVARAAALQASGDIVVTGIWSHIAETSDADDDDAHAIFDAAVDQARAAGLTPDVLHLAASAAGFARAEFRYDLVRFGAFAYGVRSTDGPDIEGIAPAAVLRASVTRVDGDTVEIGAGSLDGLPSTLSGRVVVGTPTGARGLRTVGPVSSIVDAWPGAGPGDEVELFGPGTSGEVAATTLAEAIGTVGEEILVRLSPLVPRVYVGG
ncbi:MAG: alanine racemase [Microbacterium sp.]